MACFASCPSAVSACLLHALFELSFVGILVTTRAAQVLPLINHRGFRLQRGGLFVAIRAWDCCVAAGEHKSRLLVARRAEGGRLVTFQVVTPIAGIKVWRRGKLSGVLVGMAIGAFLKLDFK